MSVLVVYLLLRKAKEEKWKHVCLVFVFIRMEYLKDGDVMCCL